jgi:transcription elongation GreA/GreB family factor
MGLPDQLESKNAEQLEEWFLDSLGSGEMPFDDMLSVLSHLHKSEETGQACDWMELVLEALNERSDRLRALEVMDLYCEWKKSRSDTARVCMQRLSGQFEDRLGLAMLRNVGFDRGVPARECVRRLGVLSRLEAGTFCYDRTWGFGVVSKIDDFYEKVTIDFDGKPGHDMSFAYAGEALELVGRDHILCIKRAEPDRIKELVRSDPAEVVRLALRSYGPVNSVRLKELLVDQICSEKEWKNFWTNARKALKEDPLVDLPARRNDPIRLLDRKKSYGGEWIEALKKERDPEKIIEIGEELEKAVDIRNAPEGMLEAFAERLAFAVKGVEGKRPDLLARAVMTALQLGLAEGSDGKETLGVSNICIDAESITRSILEPESFVGAVSGMPARRLHGFLQFLAEFDANSSMQVMLSVVPLLQSNVLNEITGLLVSGGREEECAELFRHAFASRTVGAEMLHWVCRHLDEATKWSLPDVSEVVVCVVDSLEDPSSTEHIKSKNQLRVLLENKDWLASSLERLDGAGRERLLMKLKDKADSVMRRSLMATLIKLYPVLQEAISSVAYEAEEKEVRLTSWRSYRERQEQLRKLVEESIPENSKEIGVARSYGDLRENYEYKAARERQGLLFRKRSELEKDLKEVKGAGFEGSALDKVGAGTTVRLLLPDGNEKRYVILGEWDSEETLGIISCRTPLAERLEGCRPGDVVSLPSAGEEQACTVMEITGLDKAIQDWIQAKKSVS